MKGFFNRVLLIDVGDRSSKVMELQDQELEQGLGGKGIATRLLLKHNPPKIDPFSPDNHLIIAGGPVTDTPIYGSCRHGIFTKSPQTGLYSESYSGGKAAESISRTGYDAIMIKGASQDPLFLEISDQAVRFHPAQDIWGQDTYATEDEVLKQVNQKGAAALVIGGLGGDVWAQQKKLVYWPHWEQFPNFNKWMDESSLAFFAACGLPPWRELLRTYRRLEARGEIRGGRFVAGVERSRVADIGRASAYRFPVTPAGAWIPPARRSPPGRV